MRILGNHYFHLMEIDIHIYATYHLLEREPYFMDTSLFCILGVGLTDIVIGSNTSLAVKLSEK